MLKGILNGADLSQWNPETDKRIPFNYSEKDMSGKAKCKAELQKKMGLEVNADIPVIGMVTRLVDQKGIAEVFAPAYGSVYSICANMNIQFIVAFYYIKSNFILYSIAIEVSYLINSDLLLAISVIPALILVYFYNGKKGSDSKFLKWFFYLFYPVHLAIFVTLRYISYKYYPVSN